MTVLSSSPLPPNTQTLGLLCCNTESASATLLYSFLLLMANFVCHLDWTNGAQIAGKTVFLGVSVRMFLGDSHLDLETE